MPTYDYFCSACKHELETMQKITEAPLLTCPVCHAETLVRRPGGGIGLAFSGDGFYATMYGKNKPGSEPAPKAEGGGCPCGKNKGACDAK